MDKTLEALVEAAIHAKAMIDHFIHGEESIKSLQSAHDKLSSALRQLAATPAHQPGEVGEAQGLRTVLDLLRTDRNGKKWDSIQSASGSMVDVSQFLAPKEKGR